MKDVVFVITIGVICIPIVLMGLMTGTIKYLLIVTIGFIAWAVLAEMRRKNRLRQQQINRLQEQVAEQDRKIEMLQEQQGQNTEEIPNRLVGS